ncbi:IS3 family transposase [Butyricicoccus porcorum]|uniref:HTH-like domain-containing protein n=1 Tax=Butyricicoccus porcorum TaxID=1945634 RepID=A0A252F2Z5_9FIRM|nr:hypothetical protein CBW42_08550 [Butyricicoccus porcorum]
MELLCRILHISESGYYRYLKNLSKPSKDALLSAAIDRIMNESDYNDNYGVERMQLALEQNGFHTGKRRIRRIMHEKGLIHADQTSAWFNTRCHRNSRGGKSDQAGFSGYPVSKTADRYHADRLPGRKTLYFPDYGLL